LRLKVLYHDRCFDGLASAATFTRFYRERQHADAEVTYEGLAHRAGEVFRPGVFDGDENAVVDFRYSPDPRLTWWFDHHESAFPEPGDRERFAADRSGKKFYDPKARSCTKFLADTVSRRFGFDQAPLAELISWADLSDGAQFPDARSAVELREPALQLMTLIEGTADAGFLHRVIDRMQRESLAQIIAGPEASARLAPLLSVHRTNIETFRRAARLERGVVRTDLTGQEMDAFNKFIPYYLFPDAAYTLTVTRSKDRAKISVGSNPWKPNLRRHDLSKICERYGGGGHPVVGAVSLPPGEVARARAIADEIFAEIADPQS
jgi:hypothetical protein